MVSNLAKIAEAFCHAFDDLDGKAHTALRTSDCMQYFAPNSINPPAPQDNNAFEAHLDRLRAVMKGFPVQVKEIFESEKEKRVTIWATSQALIKDEFKDEAFSAADWDYHGEYIFILSMDQSGEKIQKVVEFLDSKGTEKLQALLHHARAIKESKEDAAAGLRK